MIITTIKETYLNVKKWHLQFPWKCKSYPMSSLHLLSIYNCTAVNWSMTGKWIVRVITVFWVMHVKWLQNGKVFIKTKSNYQYPLSKYSTQLKISFSFPFIFRVDVKRVKRLTAIIDNTFNSFKESLF